MYTFLLVGRDDGGGGNTDTIMVGCYDVKNATLDVLSIYRDTLVDVPWEIKKINSVYNNQRDGRGPAAGEEPHRIRSGLLLCRGIGCCGGTGGRHRRRGL